MREIARGPESLLIWRSNRRTTELRVIIAAPVLRNSFAMECGKAVDHNEKGMSFRTSDAIHREIRNPGTE